MRCPGGIPWMISCIPTILGQILYVNLDALFFVCLSYNTITLVGFFFIENSYEFKIRKYKCSHNEFCLTLIPPLPSIPLHMAASLLKHLHLGNPWLNSHTVNSILSFYFLVCFPSLPMEHWLSANNGSLSHLT